MKITFKKYLLLSLIGISLIACKKGENDPALSLLTRRARMVGTYTVEEMTQTSNQTYSNGTISSSQLKIKGKIGEDIFNFKPNDQPETTYVKTISVDEISYRFNRDGTWESTYKVKTSWQVPFDEEPGMYNQVEIAQEQIKSGTWSFLSDESNDYKNKERIILNIVKESLNETSRSEVFYPDGSSVILEPIFNFLEQDFSNNFASHIYTIDRLTRKEIILKKETKTVLDFADDGQTEITATELKLRQN